MIWDVQKGMEMYGLVWVMGRSLSLHGIFETAVGTFGAGTNIRYSDVEVRNGVFNGISV